MPCAEVRTANAVPPLKLRGEISTKAVPTALHDAIRQTILGRRSDSKQIADALGEKLPAVYAMADLRTMVKLHQVPVMARVTNCFAVPDWIEAQLGRVAFRLPSVNPHVEEMNRELARTVKQFGEFLETSGDALADGLLEPHEVPGVLRAIDTMLAGLSEYRATVVEKAHHDAPMVAAR
jgi:hypothetical protein